MKNKFERLKEIYKDAGYHKQLFFLFIMIELTLIIEITTLPYMAKRILNVEIPSKNIHGLIIWGVIYIIILFISCYMVLKHCNMRLILKRKIQRDLREKIFNKLQKVKSKFYDDNDMGLILQFLQTDSDSASQLFPKIIVEMYFMGITEFTCVAIFLMFINVKITLSILILYLIGLLITICFNRKTITIINEIRKTNIELYSYINEGIQGFLTIKILDIIKEKEQNLKNKLEEYNSFNNKLEKVVSQYNNIFKFVISLATAIIIYYAGINVMQGIMSYAEIVLLMKYSSQLGYHFNWFIKHLTDFDKSFFAYSKILEFINKNDMEELGKGSKLENIKTIEFKKVYFSYNGNQKNIKNFSLKLKNGDKIALVGKTGSGKTTVTSLLCRFYEPINGKILINDKNYQDYSIGSIRERIGYVMQEVKILPNTIIDNIKYVNKNITLKEIEEIFKKLKLHEKIMSFKDKYNTDIYNNQDILSTGEKQLINFARVMALDKDVIILDEVTSALSYEAEELVKNAIDKITERKIAIIVAHRLSTIKECNKIILMKDGKIIEQGNHDELMSIKNEYYNLVNTDS